MQFSIIISCPIIIVACSSKSLSMVSSLLREFVVYGIAFGPLYNIDDEAFNSCIYIIHNGATTFWTFFCGMYNINYNTSEISIRM